MRTKMKSFLAHGYCTGYLHQLWCGGVLPADAGFLAYLQCAFQAFVPLHLLSGLWVNVQCRQRVR